MRKVNIDGGIVGDPESTDVDRNALENILNLLIKQTREGLHSGAQLHIALKGRTILNVAVGEARPGIPMKTNSVLLIFSSSKPLTAISIAQLWEQGKLHLNQKVQSIIPEFANGKESVTLRHLMTHVSGFPMNTYEWRGTSNDEIYLANIYKQEPKYKPGTQCGYHPSSSWMILGEIVRRIEGIPVRKYLEKSIFKPLGMKETSLGLTEERTEELGDRRAFKDTEVPEEILTVKRVNRPTKVFLPGGSGYSTAYDMGLFYKALWNGGEWGGVRIIKEKTLDYFTETQIKGIIDQTMNFRTSYGFGFFKGRINGSECSPNTFGHGGRKSCVNFCDPDLDLIVNFNSNTMLSNEETFFRAESMRKVIYDACRP